MAMIYFAACIIVLSPAFAGASPAATEGRHAESRGADGLFGDYTEIPGVTEDDVRAVESLKASRDHLVYGAPFSTEAFLGSDGQLHGFASLFCAYLSDLFGIEVRPRLMDWDELISGMNADTVDLVGELSITPERRMFLFMTQPIAARAIKYMRLSGKEPLFELPRSEADPFRYGFIKNSTIIELLQKNAPEPFVVVEVLSEDEAYERLKDGAIDAFVAESTAEAAFDNYPDVETFDYVPILYSDVSLSSKNPELVPIINVLEKALVAGIQRHLVELYNEGLAEYRHRKLILRLTPGELDFLKARIASGEPVFFAAENEHYPLSFFNDVEHEFQGVSLDVLADISRITGLSFMIWNDEPAGSGAILQALERGEFSMVTDLNRTDEMEGRFIWAENGYSSDKYALISTMETPDKEINEVLYSKVGVVEGAGWTEVFFKWFRNHGNTITYKTPIDAYQALADGEIELFMGTRNLNLSMTNYMEQSGFKVNLTFNYSFDALFGFNKNETLLCSIISKAIPLTNHVSITERWHQKTFGYRGRLARSRVPVLFGFSLMLFLLLALSFLLMRKYIGDKARLARIVSERTAELLVQTDEATKASRAKGDFLARMSHEIRTPMNAIIGMAELALRENPSDEIAEMISNIQSAGGSLLSIINDILDFSKIESGKMELANSEYQLGSLVQDVISVIGPRLVNTRLELFVELDARLPATLFGDEVRFRQILLNILSNGVKYTREGSVTLRLESGSADAPPAGAAGPPPGGPRPDGPPRAAAPGGSPDAGPRPGPDASPKADSEAPADPADDGPSHREIILTASVADTGIGVKPEDKGKLFRSFSQVNTESSKGIEGTGLGLAISKNLALMMGGDITVESEYGKGSVFTVTVRQGVPGPPAPLSALGSPQKARTVFLDPSGANARAVGFAMESLGAEYAVIADKGEIRNLIKDGGYDCIFAPLDAGDYILELKKEVKSAIKPVFFLDFGQKSVRKKGAIVIQKPLYCVPIANILNDADSGRGPKDRKDQVSFIAPEAKALVVDDIQINLKVAKGLLSFFKINVDTAESGQQAIDLVQANTYDIIFMDHMMPGMDGIEATGRIRMLPEGRYIPIIALTANAISGVREMFLSHGLSDFISKPIEYGKLETLLSEWLPKDKIKAPWDGSNA